MPKYIDAEKLKDIFEAKGDMATGTPKQVFYNAAKIVDTLPAADVVEVIRCKDCKNWQNSGSKMGESFDNMQYVGGCKWSCFRRFENDFCSYGEKKKCR